MTLQGQTQHHYQETPFDWGQFEIKERYLKHSSIGKFINKYLKGGNEKVLDCGCGIGTISRELKNRGYDVVSVDLSKTSQRLAKEKNDIDVILASNMNLPFKNASFDVVISVRVVHHTPDPRKSVKELVRVLKPGGILYLLIYKKLSIHYIERNTTGRITRKLQKTKTGKWIVDNVFVSSLIPLLYLGKVIKFRSWKFGNFGNYKNYFYDRFITPQATFHTKKEVMWWLKPMEILEYHGKDINCHQIFIVKK